MKDLSEYIIKSDIHVNHWMAELGEGYLSPAGIDRACKYIFDGCTQKKLICAGDVGDTPEQVLAVYEWLANHFDEVFIVLGNHDLWHLTHSKEDEIKQEMKKYPNFHFLDGLDDPVDGIAGCFGVYSALQQFKCVAGDKNRKNTPWVKWENMWVDGLYWKCDPRMFKVKELTRIKEILASDADVIVTHAMPYEQGVPEQYKDSDLNDYFYFHAKDIMDELVHKDIVWITGHTHTPCESEYVTSKGFKVKFICKPHGYPNEPFNNGKVFH